MKPGAELVKEAGVGVKGPLERIVRKTGVSGIVEILAERLGATDLQSLLLEVFRRRAASGDPGELMTRYAANRFARPAALPPEPFGELDALFYSLLPGGFEALELAPVAPLGATAIVTGTSQNRLVSTVRNTEVAADPTNALALECAERRRRILTEDPRSAARVALAASQRVVRAQKSDDPRSLAHFRLLGLCHAGRDSGSFSFELETLLAQLDCWLRVLAAWRERGARISSSRVRLTPLASGPSEERLREAVLEPLARAHARVHAEIDPTREQGLGYYRSACFKIHVEEGDRELEVGDGGFTDWTQRLVGSRKERCLISGVGCDRLVGLALSDDPVPGGA